MSAMLRVAVRKFDPFERAIRRQFDDFVRVSGRDVGLEIESLDLNPLHDLVFARRALNGGEFDIAFMSTDWIAEAQQAGVVADLAPHLARAPIPDFPEAWSPSLLKLQSFAGGVWGMPYHDGPQCLIYRKDLLEGAGIAPPRDWDAFVAAARQLHAPDKGVFGTALALYPDGHNSFYDFCVHVWTRGGEPFDPSGRPRFVTEQAIAALDFVRALANDATAIAPNARELDSVQSGLLFCEGKVALMTNWFGFAALGDSVEGPVKGKIDIAPLPAGPGGESVSLNVFWMLTLARGSRQPELAWDFMRHAATAAMDRLTTIEGAIGARRSTWTDPDINATVPYYGKLDMLHARAREMPRHPRLSDIAHVVDAMLTRALTSATPSAELLVDAQAEIEGIVS
jgi:multiple sugar transport system substrate-binding protein